MQRLDVRGAAQALVGSFAIRGGDSAAVGFALQPPVDAVDGGVNAALFDIDNGDVEAAVGGHLGHAVAHEAGPDDAYSFNAHASRLHCLILSIDSPQG